MFDHDASVEKEPLRFVVVGHVDHGKSTLVGRLLHDTQSLPDGKLEQLQAAAERRGVPFEWAFLMDAFKSERDQNITIDTSQIWFRSKTRPYVIIDAPGHKEFLKNMVTGAASAHAALLLIAADEGVQEQSKRHGYLLSLLGVKQVVVVVNKMDAVGYARARFDEIERDYRAYLQEIGVEPVSFIPVSAREGDNIAGASAALPWANESVLDALENFAPPRAAADGALRMFVQDVYRFDDRRIIAGRVASGRVRPGDEVIFEPGARRARVKTLERWSGARPGEARAGDALGITLEEQIFVERGQLMSAPDDTPAVASAFTARLFWMGREVRVGERLKIKLGSQATSATLEEILRVVDTSALQEGSRDTFGKNEVVEVRLALETPVALDRYDAHASSGRFVLVDGFDVAGGGVVLNVDRALGEREARPVSAAERRARHGHLAGVIALKGDGSRLGPALERALFDRGVSVKFLAGNADLHPGRLEAAVAIARAGLVAIIEGEHLRGARALRRDDATWVGVSADAALEDVLEVAAPALLGRRMGQVLEVRS